MKEFPVFKREELRPSNFNTLPFYVDYLGELFWVALSHDTVEGQLVDTMTIQRVVDGITEPVWQYYKPDNCRELYRDMMDIVNGYKAIFKQSPESLYRVDKPRYELAKASACGCEIHLGEPCYCNLK